MPHLLSKYMTKIKPSHKPPKIQRTNSNIISTPATSNTDNTEKEIPMLGCFKFSAEYATDLSFGSGDILFVKTTEDKQWGKARDWRTDKTGLVPYNHLTDQFGESPAFDAFHNITRKEAEKQLLLQPNKSGTFILRKSSEPKALGLSVLKIDGENISVSHYKVKYDENRRQYFLNENEKFTSLDDLVNSNTGPRSSIMLPCPKVSQNRDRFESVLVCRESVTCKRNLGKGNFGEVWLATYRGAEVAVKMALTWTGQKDVLQEAETMHKLYHPRLVRFLGVVCDPPGEPVWIITEYMARGSLDLYLPKNNPSYDKLITMITQICCGMAYLESRQVVHKDLRAANVLVAEDRSVKVADFGLAKFLQSEVTSSAQGPFPLRWTAPEALPPRYQIGIKADVWSFGVLSFEVLTLAKMPYEDLSDSDLVRAIEKGHRLQSPHDLGFDCEAEIYEKMRECWNIEPEKRPSFGELVDYFESQGPPLASPP